MIVKLSAFIVGNATRVALTSVVCAILASLAKFAIFGALLRFEAPAMYLRLQDSILTGVLTAIGVWASLMIATERRKFVLKEIQTVANLNHELRNALEVILGSAYLAESSKGGAILDSVERINRTLDSILGTPGSRK